MTEKAQRIAIAEACGWVQYFTKYAGGPEDSEGKLHHWKAPQKWWKTKAGKSHLNDRESSILSVPDYLNDLNACHEMEKALKDYQRVTYSRNHLVEIAGSSDMPFATAAQRCEAFLKTLNLWEEESEASKSIARAAQYHEDIRNDLTY